MKISDVVRLVLLMLLIGGCERPEVPANVSAAAGCLLVEMQEATAIWSGSYDEVQELADATERVPEEHRDTVFPLVARIQFNTFNTSSSSWPNPHTIVAAAEEIAKSMEGISWEGWERDIAILFLASTPTRKRSAVSDSIDAALEQLNVEDCGEPDPRDNLSGTDVEFDSISLLLVG